MLIQDSINCRYYFRQTSAQSYTIEDTAERKKLVLAPVFSISGDNLSVIKNLTDFSTLTIQHLEDLLPCDVILVGSGDCTRFPGPDLYREIACHNLAVDFMSSDAACRTYNILANEGRTTAIIVF